MDGLFLTSRQHWWEQVNNTTIEVHLSVTSGSRQVRTRIARSVDRDDNDCAISPPPLRIGSAPNKQYNIRPFQNDRHRRFIARQ